MKLLTGLLAYSLVGIFVYFVVMNGTTNASLFLNVHSLAIVLGGVVIAALASFPWTVLWDAMKVVVKQLNTKSRVSRKMCEQALSSAVHYQRGLDHLEKESKHIENPFLSDAVNLVLEGLERNFILEILDKRIEEKRNQIMTHMNVLLTMSKYSPAMGLAATVLGLVDLLSKLQSADLAQLGYGMAIALTATFFGVIFSNLLFAPMAELISSAGEIEIREHEIVRDAIEAMMERKNPVVIGELVNSYLSMNERVDVNAQLRGMGSDVGRAA